ncbi:MAG: phosphoenolpyruvate synthase [Oxalobacter sp.]|nr:phosphoenolpyruvate synthase [Oxalobacter sp.]
MPGTASPIQDKQSAYVIPFNQLRMTDISLVGGKNASLGEMISQLSEKGVRVPEGFATTALAFHDFLSYSTDGGPTLAKRIEDRLTGVDINNVQALAEAGAEIRRWITDTPLQPRLEQEILDSYNQMVSSVPNAEISVAVRSSSTAEDLYNASFAGQQETYLNIVGAENVLHAVKLVFASLYSDRVISYRQTRGFRHSEVALSVGIQQMIRSDRAAAGAMFTLDTESGFREVVFITSSYGLGETIMQGAVNPDEFYVHKPMLERGKMAIIRRSLGSKLIQTVFTDKREAEASTAVIDVPEEKRSRFSLSDADILELAKFAVIIERHYGCPMDIEWGKDGIDGKLYILQARSDTASSQMSGDAIQVFKLKENGNIIASGRAIGQKIGIGRVRVVKTPGEMHKIQDGDILVADMPDPDWEPVMRKAAAIVTNRGGRTCHAAIIAREIGVPAVVGCGNVTETLKDGQLVTVSCAEGENGRVYDGPIEMEESRITYGQLPVLPVRLFMNIGNPQLAFKLQAIPNAGVGLVRLEFVINEISIHPNAILAYPNVDPDLKVAIESVAKGYGSPRNYYVQKLAEGMATIGAAFWPKPVIIRLSDIKSNGYRALMGGTRYEPEEENPMLGFRGASRYLAPNFAEAFNMECEALKQVRNDMGLTNIELMVPFVRTVKQAKSVLDLLAVNGLRRGENGLRIIMMCEVPSNAILVDEFLELFDGLSIGSNDLTQLTLGLDRASGIEQVMSDFDERDPAVMALIAKVVAACNAQGKYVGICGQGPSDHPDLALWLMKNGIDAISLNPDAVVPTWKMLADSQINCS